ncbi:MAG: mandelate racemase/muconate lactonizing enzyme family protein [Acidimicrobiia bacterium]|nr:mandelate racemase/muconate lactonizing enzyme family protein [Acidimicrobiia bacterium]
MRIKSIQAFPLAYPEPHYKGIERYITLARVESDDGRVGWGECISQFRDASRATKIIIEEGFGPLVVGEEALDVERLWHKMLARIWWYGPEGIAAFAVSAVDMALWDLKGKALGLPVCQLLGGVLHNKIVAMGSIIFDMEDFDWTLNEFRWMREQGYRVVKAGWGMRPEAVFGQDRQKDLEIVRQVRRVIGDELELVVDTPGARAIWDVPTAIQRFHDLEPYRLKWIEQPLLPQDLEGHARLRAAVSTPIGTGEDEWNTESYRRLIQSRGVDVIQMDPGRCHGITGCRDVIKLIEAENLHFSAHTWSSALNTAASVHLLAISTQGKCMDFKPHESPMQHELVADPWVQEDGYLKVRSSPGLGVTVREEIVRKYLIA